MKKFKKLTALLLAGAMTDRPYEVAIRYLPDW